MTFDPAGLGWRGVFFSSNVPIGVAIIAAAWWIMPQAPRRAGTRLDIPGAIVLFIGLLGLIGPLLFGRDVGWAPWVWLIMTAGIAIVGGFVSGWNAEVEAGGGMPLIDLHLLADLAFMRGLCAVFAFFFAHLSFYPGDDVVHAKRIAHRAAAGRPGVPVPLTCWLTCWLPGLSGVRARHRGMLVLVEELCGADGRPGWSRGITFAAVAAPPAALLALPLTLFGLGQGLVMVPLSGAVLSTVPPASAGSGSGMYGTTTQIGAAAGVAAIGAVYFAVEAVEFGTARRAGESSRSARHRSLSCADISAVDAKQRRPRRDP